MLRRKIFENSESAIKIAKNGRNVAREAKNGLYRDVQ